MMLTMRLTMAGTGAGWAAIHFLLVPSPILGSNNLSLLLFINI